MPFVEPPAPIRPLEGAIRAALAAGIELTEPVRRYMEGTVGDASPAALQTLLADDSNAERDSLLDLLFFPDLTLQTAIEPILERYPPTAVDVDRLAARFKTENPAVRFLYPGSQAPVAATLPTSGVDAFLNRLNLTWQFASPVGEALDGVDSRILSRQNAPADDCIRLRVWMRNAALRQTPVQIRFLCDFMAWVPCDDQAFVDQLRFSLVFLNEHEDAANLYEALMNRKKFIFRHLLNARRSAERTARSNMETLIMTGVRTPHFDIARGERTLAMIDSIAMAVYGRTEPLEDVLRDVDLSEHTEGMDPEELIRRLS